MARLITVLVFFSSLQNSFVASQCYYPNGNQAMDDHPCDPEAEQSACCGEGLGSVCLSNKLCLGANGNRVRGSCTDQNWASSECAMYCLGADRGGTDLISCSNVTNSDTSYCCDGHRDECCNNGVARFDVLPPEPGIWATWDRGADQYVVVGTVYNAQFVSPTTGISSTRSETSAPGTTTSETSVQSESAPETLRSSREPSGLSTGAKAGIGVGVGVGVLLIAAVIYLLWKLRKTERAAEENRQLPVAYQGPPLMDAAWQQPHSPQKETPNELHGHHSLGHELHGHQSQGYGVRAELPTHI